MARRLKIATNHGQCGKPRNYSVQDCGIFLHDGKWYVEGYGCGGGACEPQFGEESEVAPFCPWCGQRQ